MSDAKLPPEIAELVARWRRHNFAIFKCEAAIEDSCADELEALAPALARLVANAKAEAYEGLLQEVLGIRTHERIAKLAAEERKRGEL